jgi:hypothetical protein
MLGISIFLVALACIVTLVGYGLSQWRSSDPTISGDYPPGIRDFMEALTVFTEFPDWWIAHALATYGEFVGKYPIGIAVAFGLSAAAIVYIKAVRPAIKS